jgi:hypothetical protein
MSVKLAVAGMAKLSVDTYITTKHYTLVVLKANVVAEFIIEVPFKTLLIVPKVPLIIIKNGRRIVLCQTSTIQLIQLRVN